MDFEAPPPFVGALEELPDVECDTQMTVDDEEEFSTEHLEIPTDLPCTSFSSVSPQLSVCKQKCATVDSDNDKGKYLNQIPNSVMNGIADDGECSRTSVDPVCVANETECEVYELDALRNDAGDEDEFGDFADFAGQISETSEVKESGHSELPLRKNSCNDSHSSEKKTNDCQPTWPSTVQASNEDDEWNAFSSPPEYKDEKNGLANIDDFDDVAPEVVEGRSDSDPVASNVPSSEMMFSPVLERLYDSMDLWNVEYEVGDDKVYNIISLLDSDASALKANNTTFLKGYELWLALRVVEDALALKFEWKGSQHRINILKTLGIDPVDAGRISSPSSMFAVLEPTPVTTNGTARRSVIISHEEGAHGAKVVSAEASATDLHTTAPTSTVESPSIPNADFDWEKSGLVNPTVAANRSSALLDVDFLWANSGGGSSCAVSTLQKELDELGLSKSCSETRLKPENQPSMLDVVMASANKSDRKIIRPPSELSLDARALHDQLPDIEFLRASMIMFPIGGNRSH